MWLPNKLYEALPWAYVVIGASFIAGVVYLDRNDYGMLVYAGLGGACMAAGLLVRIARVRIRRNAESSSSDDNESHTADAA